MIEGFIYTLRFIYALHFSINFGVYDLSLQAVLAITIYSFRILLLICDDGWCLTSFCIHNDSTYYIGNIPLGVHVVSFPDTTTKGYYTSGDIGADFWLCKLSNHDIVTIYIY